MAKQRYVNTKFWSDNFISELNPLDRYLFLYFLTNEHTNICGIYEVPLKTISFETGLELDMLKKMINRLCGKVYYINGWVYLKNFAKHQAVNDSIKKGIEASKKEVPNDILVKIKEIDSLYTPSPQDQTYLNHNINTNSNIKNINSINEIKNKYGEFENVFLSEKDLIKLNSKFGNKNTLALIEDLSTGIASKGYKYKNHYATIINWGKRKNINRSEDKPRTFAQISGEIEL